MRHAVKHDLDQDLAKKAAQKAWEAYSERFSKYNPTSNWTSDTHADVSFSVKGKKLNGSLDLVPYAIVLELDVPFIFNVFKKQAIGVIEDEITKWVEKARNGELD